jgi:hypothetical protein
MKLYRNDKSGKLLYRHLARNLGRLSDRDEIQIMMTECRDVTANNPAFSGLILSQLGDLNEFLNAAKHPTVRTSYTSLSLDALQNCTVQAKGAFAEILLDIVTHR